MSYISFRIILHDTIPSHLFSCLCPHRVCDGGHSTPYNDIMARLPRFFIVVAIVAIPTLTSAATFTRSLSVGSRGAEVTALQQTLLSLGYFQGSATGYFGKITKQSVVAFQKANNLEPIGMVGPKTRALLNAPVNVVVSEPPAPVSTTTPANIAPVAPPMTPVASASTSDATLPDTTPPTITVIGPPSVLAHNTLDTTLYITTDENATCRWGTIADMSFTSMKTFAVTGGVNHSHAFTSLGNGYLYAYYIKCQDTALNISSDTFVSFSITRENGGTPQLAAVAAMIDLFHPWPMLTPLETILDIFGF